MDEIFEIFEDEDEIDLDVSDHFSDAGSPDEDSNPVPEPGPSAIAPNRNEEEVPPDLFASPAVPEVQEPAPIVIPDNGGDYMTDSQQLAVAIQILTTQRSSPVVSLNDDPAPQRAATPPPVEAPKSPQASTSKKRKLEEENLNQSQIDDGSMCNICFDQFTQVGEHRLTSLKCGHIFGYSCIERWFNECQRHNKCCPQCKMKTTKKDFRYIYAAKLSAVDNTREVELQFENTKLKETIEKQCIQIGIQKLELERQRTMISDLHFQLKQSKDAYMMSDMKEGPRVIPKNFKLYMEKNIDLIRDSQSRVMAFGQQKKVLMISQKSSTQTLFPGFGVRFLDINTCKATTQYIHMGTKSLRDIALNPSEQFVVATTQESSCKMFTSSYPYSATMFSPIHNAVIWSCAFDKERENFMYLGVSNGLGFTYDLRNPNEYVDTFSADNDRSPVISICSLKYSSSFPLGGIFVCHLMSLWFYEYVDSTQRLQGTKLNISGPFVSMHYCDKTDLVLLYARQKEPPAKYFLVKLAKVDGNVLLEVISSFNGSRNSSIMTRSTQICKNESSVVACYNMDDKKLELWGQDASLMSNIPVSDVVTDLCPLYLDNSGDKTLLAALSENKCRILNVIPSANFLSHVTNRLAK